MYTTTIFNYFRLGFTLKISITSKISNNARYQDKDVPHIGTINMPGSRHFVHVVKFSLCLCE